MSTARYRPFAYNGDRITHDGGHLLAGYALLSVGRNYNNDYDFNPPDGLIWWMGPDENDGFIFAKGVWNETLPVPAYSPIFWRSKVLTTASFIEMANAIARSNNPPEVEFSSIDEIILWADSNEVYFNHPRVECGSILFPNDGLTEDFAQLRLQYDYSWQLGTDQFTIEWYQNLKANRSDKPTVFALNTSETSIAFWFNNHLEYCYIAAGLSYSAEIALPVSIDGAWVHFAIVRNGTKLRIYMNGLSIYYDPDFQQNIANSYMDHMYIGADNGNPNSTFFTGEITDFHIAVGSMLYNVDDSVLRPGIPPSPIEPMYDTRVLLNASNSKNFLADSSIYANTITNSGGYKVDYSTHSPYSY